MRAERLAAAAPRTALAVAGLGTLAYGWAWRERVMDDAFISFRYAAHLAGGEGLVFNPGERVEGITNLGWTLLVALAPGREAIPLLARGLGLVALVAALTFTWLAARRLADGTTPALPAGERLALFVPLPLLLAASPDLVYFALAGMESGLAAALVAAALWLAVVGGGGGHRGAGWGLGLVAALLFTVRPESLLLLPLAAAALAVDRRLSGRRQAGVPLPSRDLGDLGRSLAVLAAGAAAVTAFRLAWFGAPLPNTFAAKRAALADLGGHLLGTLDGAHANLPPPFASLLFPLAAAVGWTAIRRRSPLAAAVAAGAAGSGLAFALWAAPDWTATGRYFAPYLPAAWLLLWWGLVAAVRRLAGGSAGRRRAAAAAITAAAALLVAQGVHRAERLFGAEAALVYPGYVLAGESLVAPAQLLGERLPAGSTLATRRLGAAGFYAPEVVLFDYAFGLTDREVGRRVGARGAIFSDPRHPELAEPWRGAAPDALLEDESVVREWLADGRGGTAPLDRLTVHGLDYRLERRFPIGDGTERWLLYTRQRPP